MSIVSPRLLFLHARFGSQGPSVPPATNPSDGTNAQDARANEHRLYANLWAHASDRLKGWLAQALPVYRGASLGSKGLEASTDTAEASIPPDATVESLDPGQGALLLHRELRFLPPAPEEESPQDHEWNKRTGSQIGSSRVCYGTRGEDPLTRHGWETLRNFRAEGRRLLDKDFGMWARRIAEIETAPGTTMHEALKAAKRDVLGDENRLILHRDEVAGVIEHMVQAGFPVDDPKARLLPTAKPAGKAEPTGLFTAARSEPQAGFDDEHHPRPPMRITHLLAPVSFQRDLPGARLAGEGMGVEPTENPNKTIFDLKTTSAATMPVAQAAPLASQTPSEEAIRALVQLMGETDPQKNALGFVHPLLPVPERQRIATRVLHTVAEASDTELLAYMAELSLPLLARMGLYKELLGSYDPIAACTGKVLAACGQLVPKNMPEVVMLVPRAAYTLSEEGRPQLQRVSRQALCEKVGANQPGQLIAMALTQAAFEEAQRRGMHNALQVYTQEAARIPKNYESAISGLDAAWRVENDKAKTMRGASANNMCATTVCVMYDFFAETEAMFFQEANRYIQTIGSTTNKPIPTSRMDKKDLAILQDKKLRRVGMDVIKIANTEASSSAVPKITQLLADNPQVKPYKVSEFIRLRLTGSLLQHMRST